MVQLPRHNLLKRLQTELPRDVPFDLSVLRRLGISNQDASYYAKQGWLERIGHGVYAFPNAELAVHGMVNFLQTRVERLHVGGRSALSLQGVRHNLGSNRTLVLWGNTRYSLPEWFVSRQPARYVSAALFEWPDVDLARATLTTPPGVTDGLCASTPERAAIEMLYDVGTNESLEEARNVFEGLRNFRKDVVGKLLACCTSVKAVRLFLTWSRETELVDVELLRERFPLRVGSSARWMHRLNDGTLLTLKPYG